jgi:hypothetical protein
MQSDPASGGVICRLTITLPGGERITRSGSGGHIHTSPEKALEDPANLAAYRLKAASSDAFKRAGSKLGVGRYLGKSGVPEFARGAFGEAAPASEVPQARPPIPPRRAPPSQALPDRTRTASAGPHAHPADPVNGKELHGWLMVQEQRHSVEFLAKLMDWAGLNGWPKQMGDWDADMVARSVKATRKKIADLTKERETLPATR